MLKKKMLLSLMAIMMVGSVSQASAYSIGETIQYDMIMPFAHGYKKGMCPTNWAKIPLVLWGNITNIDTRNMRSIIESITFKTSFIAGIATGVATVCFAVYGFKKWLQEKKNQKEVKTQLV